MEYVLRDHLGNRRVTAAAAAEGALFFGAAGGAMNYAGSITKDYKLGSPNGILLLSQYKQ